MSSSYNKQPRQPTVRLVVKHKASNGIGSSSKDPGYKSVYDMPIKIIKQSTSRTVSKGGKMRSSMRKTKKSKGRKQSKKRKTQKRVRFSK